MRQTEKSLAPPPAEAKELGGFPQFDLRRSDRLFRVGRADRSPWWFGSSGAGRFDLPLPEGTCYLAGDFIAALLEVVGPDRDGGFIAAEHFAARRLYELHIPSDRTLADLANSLGASFGITLEIHSAVPYDLAQKWAARLQQAGFEGVRHLLRHDPGGEDGFALFGPAGARVDWPVDHCRVIDSDLLDQLWGSTGLRIEPIPHSRELELD